MGARKCILVVLALVSATRGAAAFQSQPPPKTTHFQPATYRHDIPKRLTRSHSRTGISGGNHGGATSTSLQAEAVATLPLVGLLSTPAGALAILAGIILIHESGHYLAARMFGIEVEEFAVGIGPKLFGFTAFGNEFNLRALPLGGYVRFPENYNATELEELQNAAYERAVAKKNMEANPTLGYRIDNALSFGAISRQGKSDQEKRAQKELKEFEQMNWFEKNHKRRETRRKDKNLDVEEVEIPYDDNPNLLQNRPWFQRAVVISGGVIFNLLLSFLIYFGEISGPRGLPSPVFDAGVRIGAIPVQTAARGLLQVGDVIVSANGVPLTRSSRPTVQETQQAISTLIAEIRATPDGEVIELDVVHEKGDFMDKVLIRPKRVTSAGENFQSIGVLLTPNYVETEILRTSNFAEAARLAYQYTSTLTAETASGLGMFLKQALLGSPAGGGASVSGPIGLLKTGSEVVATRDIQTILLFAAAISVNLGVINALPVPALDGGQLLFVLAEALTRRKLDQRLQEGITGFTVLILLMVSVGAALGDLSSIFGP